jgi:hypothetical protein
LVLLLPMPPSWEWLLSIDTVFFLCFCSYIHCIYLRCAT